MSAPSDIPPSFPLIAKMKSTTYSATDFRLFKILLQEMLIAIQQTLLNS